MSGLPAFAVGMIGLVVGCIAGFLVQRARLCTFGAVEDALAGGNWRRMKAYGLALAIALLGTQALVAFMGLDPAQTPYVPAQVALPGAFVGAMMFGLGMALVGTCAFGSLVRLGTGDLRSLVALIVFGACAYAILRGVLAGLRIDWVEKAALPMPFGTPSAWTAIAEAAFSPWASALLVIALAAGFILIAVSDERLMRSPRLLAAAIGLGLCVVTGWAVTGPLADPFDMGIRVQSLTYVAPVARGLFGLLIGEAGLMDFGVLCVAGVVIGSAASALSAREFRWEAFDDHHEMRRHMAGAALMGFGGVLAGGCTIGQGLSAGSLMAVSWPFTVAGMVLGARIGIAILVEGSVLDWLRALTRREESRPSAE